MGHYIVEYGDLCKSQGPECQIEFSPDMDIVNPHLYYELDPFFSNYRNLVTTSDLFKQLRGEDIDHDSCQGVEHVSDLLPDLSIYSQFTDVNLAELPPDTPLNPCGILPKYIFSDNFALKNV